MGSAPPVSGPPVSGPPVSGPPLAVPRPRAAVPIPTGRPPRPSNVALSLTMALTGTVFALFVLVHMIGNLKVYTGAEHFDAYAHWLRTLAEPLLPYEGALWVFRLVLLVCLLLHVGASAILVMRARRAKGPHRRRGMGWRAIPATLMPWTGAVLLVFIVVHILDLTTGTKPVAPQSFTPTTATTSYAYDNLVASFERWPMALFYIVVMLMLGLHLVHGLWGLATGFGATGQRLRQLWCLVALVLAVLIAAGNISIPLAVLSGLVH